MDVRDRILFLNQEAELEAADAFASPTAEQRGHDLYPCVSHVMAPGGRAVPVLKVLQSNACRNNCYYCGCRASRDFRRERLTSSELARSVDLMFRAGIIQGLFLSSGIGDTVKTMDEMLATAELLRTKYAFRGYLHLKLLPGVEEAQVVRAVELADRVSTNLEAPDGERLERLAPQKCLAQLVGPLRAASVAIARHRELAGSLRRETAANGTSAPVGYGRLGISTQFVVGPAGESDRDLLGMAAQLYRELRLARAYYSPFRPVAGTPLEDVAPTALGRKRRLYQADWLLRYYRFDLDELPFDGDGLLSGSADPKLAWAERHPERFPIEVNRAPVEELLRVPGIGPASARAIIQARRQGTLRTPGDLRRLGARADQAAPFVLLAGRRPPCQLPLPLPAAILPESDSA